jgi:hypothetical protein
MPWLLDVIFTLAGRVRPYHKVPSMGTRYRNIRSAMT